MDVFVIRLLSTTGPHHFSQSTGTSFHGYFHHIIPKDLSSRLHSSEVPLYHFKLKYTKQMVEWIIISFDKDLSENIRDVILHQKEVFIKHKKQNLKVLSALEVFSLELDKWLVETQDKMINVKDIYLNFTSPTGHKVRGNYLKQFDLEVAYKHIVRKLNFLQDQLSLSFESVDVLVQGTKIVKDFTKSSTINLKGVKIPAYEGVVHLRWVGDSDNLSIVHLLWLFAELSGIGIKTAMGYGNIEIM